MVHPLDSVPFRLQAASSGSSGHIQLANYIIESWRFIGKTLGCDHVRTRHLDPSDHWRESAVPSETEQQQKAAQAEPENFTRHYFGSLLFGSSSQSCHDEKHGEHQQ